MFQIEEIDPKFYRKRTRNATIRIMALFLVIGMVFAMGFVEYLGAYNSNKIVLNLLGAFTGLVITGLIVRYFFIDSDWMKEAMYAWRLKRNLMYITNVLDKIKAQANQNDEAAMKVLRFYHLGLEQMHRLEDNSHAQVELIAEKNQLEARMQALHIEINQIQFDPAQVEPYQHNEH